MKKSTIAIDDLTTNASTPCSLGTSAKRKLHKLLNPQKTWATYATIDAKKRADRKNVPFDLPKGYIESILPTHCPVFNTKFQYGGNGKVKPESPALDRIIPRLGYIQGNVQIISVKANNIKSAYNSNDIQMVADWLRGLEENKG